MGQKLYCPMCKKKLIENDDLITDKKVVFDLLTIKSSDKEIKQIKCQNCKRKIRYIIEG